MSNKNQAVQFVPNDFIVELFERTLQIALQLLQHLQEVVVSKFTMLSQVAVSLNAFLGVPFHLGTPRCDLFRRTVFIPRIFFNSVGCRQYFGQLCFGLDHIWVNFRFSLCASKMYLGDRSVRGTLGSPGSLSPTTAEKGDSDAGLTVAVEVLSVCGVLEYLDAARTVSRAAVTTTAGLILGWRFFVFLLIQFVGDSA